MALGRNIRRIREALGIGQKALAEAAGMKLMPLWQLEERDSIRSKYDFAIAAALGVPVELLVTGTEADIDAWLASRQRASDPRVIDVQAREVREQAARPALSGPRSSDALDAVRGDVQALPPELRDVLARLVTEYLTAADDRKDVLRAAIERLKGGQYQRGASGT